MVYVIKVLTYLSFCFLQLSVLFCIAIFALGLADFIRMYEVQDLLMVGMFTSAYCTFNLIALALTKYILEIKPLNKVQDQL